MTHLAPYPPFSLPQRELRLAVSDVVPADAGAVGHIVFVGDELPEASGLNAARAAGLGFSAKAGSSLVLPTDSGRGQTEVRWLNGAVAAHGEKLGVPTPVNRMLTDVLESLSAGTENLGRFRGDPQALLDLLK